ncbi:MAG: SUMF1/EgtB/PvdO family nonheme iron enzyme [Planctomycetes bacterium]|nr:SUMF1/EgtB/PvdO family nonheme iron enzyme [Planctomycetota bacterium]
MATKLRTGQKQSAGAKPESAAGKGKASKGDAGVRARDRLHQSGAKNAKPGGSGGVILNIVALLIVAGAVAFAWWFANNQKQESAESYSQELVTVASEAINPDGDLGAVPEMISNLEALGQNTDEIMQKFEQALDLKVQSLRESLDQAKRDLDDGIASGDPEKITAAIAAYERLSSSAPAQASGMDEGTAEGEGEKSGNPEKSSKTSKQSQPETEGTPAPSEGAEGETPAPAAQPAESSAQPVASASHNASQARTLFDDHQQQVQSLRASAENSVQNARNWVSYFAKLKEAQASSNSAFPQDYRTGTQVDLGAAIVILIEAEALALDRDDTRASSYKAALEKRVEFDRNALRFLSAMDSVDSTINVADPRNPLNEDAWSSALENASTPYEGIQSVTDEIESSLDWSFFERSDVGFDYDHGATFKSRLAETQDLFSEKGKETIYAYADRGQTGKQAAESFNSFLVAFERSFDLPAQTSREFAQEMQFENLVMQGKFFESEAERQGDYRQWTEAITSYERALESGTNQSGRDAQVRRMIDSARTQHSRAAYRSKLAEADSAYESAVNSMRSGTTPDWDEVLSLYNQAKDYSENSREVDSKIEEVQVYVNYFNMKSAFDDGRFADAVTYADAILGSRRSSDSQFADLRSEAENVRELSGRYASMVLIRGSERFTIGSQRHEWEKPQHDVAVADFLIDPKEITCDEFAAFIADRGYEKQNHWSAGGFGDRDRFKQKDSQAHGPSNWENGRAPGAGDLPVTGISWYEAMAYASWAGKRLPTEVEWECAARGGVSTQYPWGSSFSRGAVNFGDNASLKASGATPQTSNGIYDIIGNAAEWTNDVFAPYPQSGDSSENWPPQMGPLRVVRGGSYLDVQQRLTPTARDFRSPLDRRDYIGFRCAKNYEE